jgi:hypothetical protein
MLIALYRNSYRLHTNWADNDAAKHRATRQQILDYYGIDTIHRYTDT